MAKMFFKKNGGLLMMMVEVYKVGSEGYVCVDASACLIFFRQIVS